MIVPGHHGSATATTWDLLQKTVPEYAVISCGAGNSYGHPHKDTMDKLADMGIQVFRTDEQGTVIAVSDGSNIQWNQSPCNDYSAGDESDTGTQPSSAYKDSGASAMDLLIRLLQILRPECRPIRSQWVIWSGSPLPEASTTGSLTAEI